MENINQKIQELLNLFKSKKFIEAEILAKQSIEMHPENVFLYNFLGLVLSELKRNEEAINIFNQGIKIDKNFSLLYNNLGIIYQFQKKYKKAKLAFKENEALMSFFNAYNFGLVVYIQITFWSDPQRGVSDL